jgi:hypothetical protein
LDAKAKDASINASAALTKASDAEIKAAGAEITAGKAQAKADLAQNAANTAFTAASHVKGIADSANVAAGKAENKVEGVATRAEEIRKRVEEIAPRTIAADAQQQIVTSLRKSFWGHPAVTVGSYSLDGEGTGLATELIGIIRTATGTRPNDARTSSIVAGGFELGVSIRGPDSERPFMLALQDALTSIGQLKLVYINGVEPPTGAGLSGNAGLVGRAGITGGGGPPRQPTIPAKGPVIIMVGIKPIQVLVFRDK